MKRNLLALAIPALLVAGAANASIEVYNKDGNKLSINGQAEVVNYLGDHNKTAKEGDDSNAKIGFTGETQITDSITGYGRAEWETTTSNDANVNTRYAYAGLDFGTAGAVDYGKADGALKAITSYTDVLPKFGGDTTLLLNDRTQAVLTYHNAKLVDGLSFAIQYADNDKDHKNSEVFGLNAQYAIADTGVTVGAGYAHAAKRSGTSFDVTDKYDIVDDNGSDIVLSNTDVKHDSFIAGVNYDANNLYLAAIYGYDVIKLSPENAESVKSKTKSFEAVAQYGIDLDVGTVKPSLAYIQNTTKISDVKIKNHKYVSVGAIYDFNKNLSFVADYKINLLKKDDSAYYKNSLGLGLSYQF